MKSILRNILAVFVGGLLGMAVNIGIIILGSKLIPPPEGINPMDGESLKNNIHLFQLKHYLSPFLGHAGGTLTGAFVAAKVSENHHLIFAMVIGVFFLVGGIAATQMIPAPLWYNVVDLVFCYIPMAWLGWKFSGKS
ncbi:MAG: hypothetical protein QGH24_00830 [Candidatus Marinimicrobia bacterium]|jgi:hypothetical protein|nr:hypothetical protein [Candidatus Neomarinimicrobiota bacterium]|tara:strand:- start:107 stop:517 length:411 start_codon:yes stop_codon:yes gene_type:complete